MVEASAYGGGGVSGISLGPISRLGVVARVAAVDGTGLFSVTCVT